VSAAQAVTGLFFGEDGAMASVDNIGMCPSCGARNRLPVAAKGRPRCAKCKADLPWLVSAGDVDIDAALDTSQLVLIDLWAPWCGPCRMVAPVLEKLARRYSGRLKVVKVNVDDAPRTAQRFDAHSIPTLVVFDRGRPIQTIIGAQPEPVLVKAVDAALSAR
jgi:thioredoxin 2